MQHLQAYSEGIPLVINPDTTMKTSAQTSILVSFGSWLRKATAAVRREANRAIDLHLQNCEVLVEAYRRK